MLPNAAAPTGEATKPTERDISRFMLFLLGAWLSRKVAPFGFHLLWAVAVVLSFISGVALGHFGQ